MPLYMLKNMGLFFIFASACYLAYSLAPKRRAPEFDEGLGGGAEKPGEGARFVNIFRPFFQLLAPLIKKLPFPGYKKKVEKYAITAGLEKEISGDDFIGFQITIGLILASMTLFYKTHLLTIIAFILGAAYPYLWLYDRRKNRQKDILTGMPDIVDVLSLSVEAGLDFGKAIKEVCDIFRKDNNPFVVEMDLMNQRMRLGSSRGDSLRVMADRVDLQELHSFTSILIQAEDMGSSISEVLKTQAKKMRRERLSRAERQGATASQKLLAPTMLLIFPVIFIVIFGPYLLKFYYE